MKGGGWGAESVGILPSPGCITPPMRLGVSGVGEKKQA